MIYSSRYGGLAIRVVDSEASASRASALIGVLGMSCVTCAELVRSRLFTCPGVFQVEIDLDRGLARVDYDPTRVGYVDLLKAVAQAGPDCDTYRAFLI